jgi:aarF domain-containing kinase
VRPEITPEPYRRAFKVLQTDAPCEPLAVVVGVIERELGRPIAELFTEIEERPCGSASTAQAHVARLHGAAGRQVVVKVQYPDAEELFNSDIVSLSQLARLKHYFDDDDTNVGLEAALAEFKKQFSAEFDYEREVRDMQDIGDSLRKHPKFSKSVCVPEPIEGLCTGRVITMTYLPGPTLEAKASALLKSVGINLREGVKSVISKQEKGDGGAAQNNAKDDLFLAKPSAGGGVARRFVRLIGPDNALRLWRFADFVKREIFERFSTWVTLDVIRVDAGGHWGTWAAKKRAEINEIAALSYVGEWCHTLIQVHGYEIFSSGIFNGDPHPGNILCLEDGRLGLIDYGQCKHLARASQKSLARLICSVADDAADAEVAGAFRQVGLVTKNDDTPFIAAFARLCLGPLRSEHLEYEWHMKLHAADKVTVFPPDLIIFLRVAALLRGLSLVLKQNVSVAEQWRGHAKAALL